MENLSAIAELGNTRSGRGKLTYYRGISDNLRRAALHVERERPERLVGIKPSETEPAPAPAPIAAAPVTTYTEALAVIRARLGDRLNISYENFDTLCTFAPGLSGKIFGPSQVKRFGLEKFFDAIRGAGLRIRFEEDPEQTAMILDRIKNNFLPRQAQQARPCNTSHPSAKMIDGVLSYLTRKKGGLSRLNTALREARSVIALRGHATRRYQRLAPRALPPPAPCSKQTASAA
jgi:hypothetical protein